MTDAERKLRSQLRRKQTGARFRRQVAFGPCILDFFSFDAKLVIELDGSQHYTEDGRRRDIERDAYLRRQSLTILRFSDYEVLTNIDGVVQSIWMQVEKML
jgi:very-short-patch-repair endonuclease